jgi:hypothetical protein
MKNPLILFTITTISVCAQEAIPTPFAKERYEEMFASSPFVLATEVKVEEPKDSPLNNVYVTSMSLAADGRTVVYVKRPGDEHGIKLVGDETDADSGISVVSVNWADGWKNARVMAKHGAEKKELRFNENAVPATPPQQPQAGGRSFGGNRMAPGTVQPGGAFQPQPATPGGPVQVPKVSPGGSLVPRPTTTQLPQVPRPGSGATLQAPQGGQPSFTPNAGDSRNRVRTIDNRGGGRGGR